MLSANGRQLRDARQEAAHNKSLHAQQHLVAVVLGLERTLGVEAEVICLDSGELGELDANLGQVRGSDLLIELLGEHVNAQGVGSSVGPEGNLGQDLVGERVGHDERRVASGASQVDQATLSQENDVVARGHLEAVDLGLDVDVSDSVLLQPGDIQLNIEVTNVADNRIILHGSKVLATDDVTAAGGGDEDVALLDSILHGGDFITLHGGLKSVDGVDLSDEDTGTHTPEGSGGSLADITISGNDGNLSGNHNISGTLDSVDQGLTASVQVVELGLGDRVVDVDGGNLELVLLEHLVQVVDTGGGLLRDTLDVGQEMGVLLVNKGGQVTTIVQDHVGALAAGEGGELLLKAPDVLLISLTLPGIDGNAGLGNGSGSVVLGREDVAGSPGNLGTEIGEGLDQDSGLDGHVERTGNTGALEDLLGAILLAKSNETGHLILSELDLLATVIGEADVGNFVRHGGCGGVEKREWVGVGEE